MKFLIIEDDEYKKNKIIACIEQHLGSIQFESVKSVNSAVILLENLSDDVIILLDMSLPTYDLDSSSGGKPQGFGGVEILRNMEFFGLKNRVIVITQYESIYSGDKELDLKQIQNNLENEFGEIFYKLIHFSVVSDTWKENLIKSINELNNG